MKEETKRMDNRYAISNYPDAAAAFQRRTSLRVDGVCGCSSWKKISTAVIGVGRTKTTID